MKDVASGRFNEIGRTERLMNTLNPEFAKKLLVDYFFEESQKMKFEIYDIDSDSVQLSAHVSFHRTGFLGCSFLATQHCFRTSLDDWSVLWEK